MIGENVFDIATSLEYDLSSEQEMKYLALKALHAKKIKALMVSVDKKDKEISKLNFMSKDNHRSLMIQGLKDKIGELETIIDILKEDMATLKDSTKEEINEYIIKKTTAGPKRIRPLTREELENKISDLEKSVTNYQAKIQTMNSGNTSRIRGRSRSQNAGIGDISFNAQGKDKLSNGVNAESKAQFKNSEESSGENDGDSNMLKFVELMDENINLKSKLQQQLVVQSNLQEELSLLRNQYDEANFNNERQRIVEDDLHELKLSFNSVCSELDDTSKKLSEFMEENIQLKTDLSLLMDDSAQEVKQLTVEMQRLFQQNNSLVEQLTKTELELESFLDGSDRDSPRGINSKSPSTRISSSATTTPTNRNTASNDDHIKELEMKLAKSTETIKQLESKCRDIDKYSQRIDELNESIHSKNSIIRDLETSLQEEKLRGSSPRLSASKSSSKSLTPSMLSEETKLYINAILDLLVSCGNGLVSLNNQFEESQMVKVMENTMPLYTEIRQSTERLLKGDVEDTTTNIAQLFSKRKLDSLIRLCSKIEESDNEIRVVR